MKTNAVFGLVMAGLGLTGPAFGQAYPRVETAAALAQIIKRVDPIVPPEAAAKGIGGAVIADVVIASSGTVASVTILDGSPLLRVAATAAIRQWTFKPFIRGGKPSPVQVILEVAFPDPVAEAAHAVYKAHEAAWYQCQRQLEIDPRGAEGACAEAVRTSEQLPADRRLERSHSRSSHAMTLMRMGRAREALAEIEAAIAVRTSAVASPDADNADLFQLAAFLHDQLGERAKAESLYALSIKAYTGAIDRLPEERARYDRRLKMALERYAAFKRASGDATSAGELERRAAGISLDNAPAAVAPAVRRMSGNLQIIEAREARLSDQEVEKILAIVGRERARVWQLQTAAFDSSDGAGRVAEAYLEPDSTGGKVRRGRVVRVTTGGDRTAAANTWRAQTATSEYVQVQISDSVPASWSPPIRLQAAPNRPSMNDDDVVALVTFLHAKSRGSTAGERLLSEVQPWPLSFIVETSTEEVNVDLREPASGRRQLIRMKRVGSQWAIVRMY